MGGAIVVTTPAFLIARRRAVGILGDPLNLPAGWPVDSRLLIGAALFGLGWGLVGVCPGPAIVLLGLATAPAWVFGVTMVAGGLATIRLGVLAS